MPRAPMKASPPPRARSLVDHVVADISGRIAAGSIRPGDTMPSLVDLAQQYAVSASVVREAVNQLSTLGLLDVVHGRPTRVCEPSARAFSGIMNAAVFASTQGMRDAIELRYALEPMIAETAATRATLADVERVERALRQMERHAGTIRPWVRADLDFHLALAWASNNKLLYNLFDSLRPVIYETMYVRRVTYRQHDPQVTLARHRAILERVAARDAAGARQEMVRHSTVSPERLAELIEAWPRSQRQTIRAWIAEETAGRTGAEARPDGAAAAPRRPG